MKTVQIPTLAKSLAIAFSAIGIFASATSAYAAGPVRPQTLVTPPLTTAPTTSSTLVINANPDNNGNHGSKSVDNSRNCTKNNDNNAQNQGNCPGSF